MDLYAEIIDAIAHIYTFVGAVRRIFVVLRVFGDLARRSKHGVGIIGTDKRAGIKDSRVGSRSNRRPLIRGESDSVGCRDRLYLVLGPVSCISQPNQGT